jgi:hypothetical protein
MTRRHSRSEAEMDARLDALDPSSERFKVLAAARRFKASWVELGQNLTLSREQGSFKVWGFATFEAYCRRELRIKQDTANKLTRSFAFLRDHEPDVLEGAGEDGAPARELPPLDVVDLLSQARERTQVSDEALATLQEEVFAPEAKATRQGLMKKLREHDPEAFRPTGKGEAAVLPAANGDNDLRKALLLAERLEVLLTAQDNEVFGTTLKHAHSVVTGLRECFEQSRRAGAA